MDRQQAINEFNGLKKVFPILDELWDAAISALEHHPCGECKCGQEPRTLTVEELLQLDNVPIWVKTLPDEKSKYNSWCIFNDGCAEIPMCDHWWFELKDYGKTWLAYDRQPKEASQ